MKLLTRLNLILLPVIMIIFMITGVLVYQTITQKMERAFVQAWGKSLEAAQGNVENELRTYQSSMNWIMYDQQFVKWVNSSDHALKSYYLDSHLYDLVTDIIKKNNTGIQSFQVFGGEEGILLSVDNDVLFSDEIKPKLALSIYDTYRQELLDSEQSSQRSWVIYLTENRTAMVGVLQAINPGTLPNDSAFRYTDRTLINVITGELKALKVLQDQLASELTSDYRVKLIPNESQGKMHTGVTASPPLVISHDGTYPRTISVDTTLYELRLELGEQLFIQQREQLAKQLLILMFSASCFCFFGLHRLISTQIVLPINRLVKNIGGREEGKLLNITRMDSKDELSTLNNTYLDLLEKINHEAMHDHLTGMPNRRYFQKLLILLSHV